MSEIILRKYHGVGNDYLIFDPKKNDVVLNERLIRQLCRRNIGVGADGILYGPVMEDKKIKVRIFNPDGSEAEKSGNGIRIFSRYYLWEIRGFRRRNLSRKTIWGIRSWRRAQNLPGMTGRNRRRFI